MILGLAADFATSAALVLASSECSTPLSVIVFLPLSSATLTSFRSACSSAFSTLSLYEILLTFEHAIDKERAVSKNTVAMRFISFLLNFSISFWAQQANWC